MRAGGRRWLDCGICFNGAAPARARNARGAGAERDARVASTGPRPRGRGMRTGRFFFRRKTSGFNGAAPARARNEAGRIGGARGVGEASTGPRPRGRGMAVILILGAGMLMGFNGAAPARARNDLFKFPAPLQQTRFNGAAPARARNGVSAVTLSISDGVLQRGRARAGAECRGNRPGCSAVKVASTGPRPRGRGMHVNVA